MLMRMLSFGVLVLLLGSCEPEDRTIRVSGRVFDEVDRTPIPNIGVTLRTGSASYGGYPIVSSALTDSTGYFLLFYDPKNDHALDFAIMTLNDNPYRDSYSVVRMHVHYGEHWERALSLRKN